MNGGAARRCTTMWLNDVTWRGESVTRLEDAEEVGRSKEWERLRNAHLVAKETRPVSSANGVHHSGAVVF